MPCSTAVEVKWGNIRVIEVLLFCDLYFFALLNMKLRFNRAYILQIARQLIPSFHLLPAVPLKIGL